MKIKIFAAMHGRHDVFRIFKAGVDRLQKSFDCELFIVCSSDEDATLCNIMGIKNVRCANDPISDKHNYGVRQAMNDSDWTHLLIMGSDDVITDAGMGILTRLDARHSGFYGGLFYNTENGDCKHWDYPRDLNIKRLFGAGRMLKRELIEYAIERIEIRGIMSGDKFSIRERKTVPRQMAEYLCASKRWKRGEIVNEGIWETGLQKGLDVSLESILTECGAPPVGISGVHVCDFKSKDNLWRYDERDGSPYSFDDFAKNLSDEELDLIYKLKQK